MLFTAKVRDRLNRYILSAAESRVLLADRNSARVGETPTRPCQLNSAATHGKPCGRRPLAVNADELLEALAVRVAYC
jgi:hypothetical protein